MTMIAQQMPLVAAADSRVPSSSASATGSAPLAAAKLIVAERFRTKMCRTYIKTGTCPYEHRCMFAHGTHEIRTKAMNIADGITNDDAVKAFQRKARAAAFAAAQPPAPPMGAATPPAYSSYGVPTASMGVLEPGEEVYYNAYHSQPSPMQYAPYDGPYASYDGPCQCDECLAERAAQERAAQAPCECTECAAAAAAAVCTCAECVDARNEQSSGYNSDEESMMP